MGWTKVKPWADFGGLRILGDGVVSGFGIRERERDRERGDGGSKVLGRGSGSLG